MSTTVGEMKTLVLNKMREYSNGGEVISTSDNKDYLLSLIPLVNLYQSELSVSIHKINAEEELTFNMPENLLGIGQWYEDQVHEGDDDRSLSTIGARCYSLQVNGNYEVYIEEETSPDVWTLRQSHVGVTASSIGYETIVGFTDISDITNSIRIRFSGAYRYLYRYIGLFDASYALAADLPKYLPWVPVDMPVKFYKFNRIDVTIANQQLTAFTNYRMEEYDKSRKRFFFEYDFKGQIDIHYFAYPTKLPLASVANPDDQNDLELDIADEAIPTLVHRIASNLLKDENAYMADSFEEDYFVAKGDVDDQSVNNQGRQGFVDNTGGW